MHEYDNNNGFNCYGKKIVTFIVLGYSYEYNMYYSETGVITVLIFDRLHGRAAQDIALIEKRQFADGSRHIVGDYTYIY